MKIEFVSYTPTPGEKHLGVATVNFGDQIYLRYKVVEGKDGKGKFYQPAAHKIGEDYVASFTIDSNFAKDKIMACIKEGIARQSVSYPNKQVLGDEDIPF